MKYRKLKFLIFFSSLILLCACAKREEDTVLSNEDLEYVKIEDIQNLNGTTCHYSIEVGEECIEVDADVTVPPRIYKGGVKGFHPAVEDVREQLHIEKDMEQVEKNMWAVKSMENDVYEYVYTVDDDYATYTNAGCKTPDMNNESVDENQQDELKALTDKLMSGMKMHSKILWSKSDMDFVFFCSSLIDEVPVVTRNAGFGGTQIYMSDGVVGSALIERQYEILEKNETDILSLDTALEMFKSHYINGDVAVISKETPIKHIRLAYYVDEEDKFIPVWCFSIDFPEVGNEYTVCCVNALTGELVFDYTAYAVEGEG